MCKVYVLMSRLEKKHVEPHKWFRIICLCQFLRCTSLNGHKSMRWGSNGQGHENCECNYKPSLVFSDVHVIVCTFCPRRRCWSKCGTLSPWQQSPGSSKRFWPSTWRPQQGAWRVWTSNCMILATEGCPHKRYDGRGLVIALPGQDSVVIVN